jgi:uncharacterized protein
MIMSSRLPDWIDPFEFAEKRRRLQGELPLADMERVQEYLLEREGVFRVNLSFAKVGRLPVVTGTVEGELVLRCQVCLASLVWPVRSKISLGVVSSLDEADRLPEIYDPLMVEGDSMWRIIDLVEDELLLAIPHVPRHGNCHHSGVVQAEPILECRENSFAALARLKNNT